MRAKSEQLVSALGNEYFKASTGWLYNFKNRNNIYFKLMCDENGTRNILADERMKTFKIIKIYFKIYFNVDEMGIFYKCTSNKTLASTRETCSG